MKTNKIKSILLIAAILISVTGFSQEKITVKGSDTMVILAQKWAELYMKKNPAASIPITDRSSRMVSGCPSGSVHRCEGCYHVAHQTGLIDLRYWPNIERPHHLVVFVLKDVAMPHI